MDATSKVYRYQLPRLVQWMCFWTARTIFRGILFCCVKVRTVKGFPKNLPDGFIVATNHNSHLDAHVLGSLLFRKVDWLSRVEFFRHPLWSFLLHAVSAIPIHRQGVPVRAIRTAIRTLEARGNIGICPEGEVMAGAKSVIYGGNIKRGVGLLARHTGMPVVPCVILGVEQLCRVEPWLPARRGEVWINVGEPIHPRMDLPPRESREMLCRELEAQFCKLFHQIRENYSLPSEVLP